METDEKGLREQRIRESLIMRVIVLAVLAICVMLLIGESVFKVRSNVKKIIRSSESVELQELVEKDGYKAGLALKSCVKYIDRLEDENSQLSAENEGSASEIQNLQGELEDLRKKFTILSSEGAAKYQLCSLFTGGTDTNQGAVFKDGVDDTIIYMNYATKSEGNNKWELYDRLEVDLYKRSGYWANDLNRSISAVLPVDLDESVYHVLICLRTDAYRMSMSEQEDQPAQLSNGGSVTFSVGGQNVAASKMRLGGSEGEGDGMVKVQGGEEIILTINPQNNTNFFSFAVCLEKDIPNSEEGEIHD